MLKFLKTFGICVVLFGCAQSSISEQSESTIVVADAKATFVIDGMMCEVGCAKYIDEELEKMEGVIDCDIDFESKTANVKFDNSLISEYAMIDVIESLKDSIYKVTQVEVEILKSVEKTKIDTH
jgi:copper chaperone CopZ